MTYLFYSSFYGHVELLSGTELTKNQNDLGELSAMIYNYKSIVSYHS